MTALGAADALALGPALVERSRATGRVAFAGAAVSAEAGASGGGATGAVVLGAHQRAASVVDVERCRSAGVLLLRRATSGTAVFVGGTALLAAVALPRVDSLFPDATYRTLLNRNVRPLLRGLTAAGALAHYFGREWVSCRKRPAMALGFDVAPDGVVLIEAIAGVDHPIAIPDDLAADTERELARWSAPPVPLAEVLPAGTPVEQVVACLRDAFSARAGELLGLDSPHEARAPAAHEIQGECPAPDGIDWLPPARIPIGWLERGWLPGPPSIGLGAKRLWLGGDVLAPRWALDRVALHLTEGKSPETLGDLPIEGVSAAELFEKALSGA